MNVLADFLCTIFAMFAHLIHSFLPQRSLKKQQKMGGDLLIRKRQIRKQAYKMFREIIDFQHF